jgi:hypothetical protein
VFLGSDEQKFMEASLAYVAGRPILTDQQYDELKMKLKVGKMMSKCSSDQMLLAYLLPCVLLLTQLHNFTL